MSADRIRMEVVGLTASPQNSGAFALILKEAGGERRLSILIGQEPAHAIAVELESMQAPRPNPHDLIKSVIESLGSSLIDITITDLQEGTYYAMLRLKGTPNEIDARPSDAIAVAIRFGAPIYVLPNVLEEAESSGGQLDDELFSADDDEDEPEGEEQVARPLTRREQLQTKLDDAVNREDYEVAAKIRDEIDRLDRTKSDL